MEMVLEYQARCIWPSPADGVSWNRTEAARILKVSYKTLLRKISENGLMPPLRRWWGARRRDPPSRRRAPTGWVLRRVEPERQHPLSVIALDQFALPQQYPTW